MTSQLQQLSYKCFPISQFQNKTPYSNNRLFATTNLLSKNKCDITIEVSNTAIWQKNRLLIHTSTALSINKTS